MKKTLVLTTIALLVSGSAVAKTWVLTNAEEGMDKGNWQINSDQLKVKDHAFSIEQKVLHGGKQEGSKILTIHSKDGLTITLSPTRGMNLLRIEGFGSRMGWDSPVKEVVNPAFINLESRNGLGWLEGFNEMMVRCGYEWTGHPVTADGQIYTLHGKAGNTPASLVEVEVADSAPYEIRIRGLVKESTFKKADLQTLTEEAVRLYGEKLTNANVVDDVIDFMLGRFRAWYQDEGYGVDTIQAVLARRPTRPADFDARMKAVSHFRTLEESSALAAANKRVSNILAKSDETLNDIVHASVLKEAAEIKLAGNLVVLRDKLQPYFAAGRYQDALIELAALREPVDEFFENVMVNAEDKDVRINRLTLLSKLRELFLRRVNLH